jgi:hypothetical protein
MEAIMKRKLTRLPLLFFIIAVIGLVSIYKSNDRSTVAVNISQAQAEETKIIYHGNKKSKKFHKPSCRYYNCKNCTVVFKTEKTQ